MDLPLLEKFSVTLGMIWICDGRISVQISGACGVSFEIVKGGGGVGWGADGHKVDYDVSSVEAHREATDYLLL